MGVDLAAWTRQEFFEVVPGHVLPLRHPDFIELGVPVVEALLACFHRTLFRNWLADPKIAQGELAVIPVGEGLPACLALVAGGADAPCGDVGLERSRGDAADLAEFVGGEPGALACRQRVLQGVEASVDRAKFEQDCTTEVGLGHEGVRRASRRIAQLRTEANRTLIST